MPFSISRRRSLQALAALPALMHFGCAAEEGEAEEMDLTEAQELLRRYKKIVVVVMENRSFDHYFGHLSLPVPEGGEGRTDVAGFTRLADHANPDLNGNKVLPFHATNKGIGDIDHEWEACHAQFAQGSMNGFVRAHQEDLVRLNDSNEQTVPLCFGTKDEQGVARCGDPKDPMAFYKRADTPVYHQLLDEYVLCDNWFSSVMGPTWPNRYYLHAGSAGGRKLNKPLSGIGSVARNSIFGTVAARKSQIAREVPRADPNRQCVDFFADVPLLPIMFPTVAGLGDGIDFLNFLPNFNYAHLFDAPRPGGVTDLSRLSGKVFGGAVPSRLLDFIAEARRSPTFETLCREGKLPAISYVEPPYQLAPMDDHPPHNIMAGQAFISSIYKMLRNSPDWNDTLLVITYDEHGSFYDHVKPGVVAEDSDSEFRQLGFRVPSLVIGAGVKKSYVAKRRYDHCSVLATMNMRWGLEPSNDRVKAARHLADCISTDRNAGASGNLNVRKVALSERAIMHSAELADGQKEIVEKVFHGNVPFEAKRIFTNEMLAVFDRLGVASIT